MGSGSMRAESRQLVSHSHTVNGQSVNIPSYAIKAGDALLRAIQNPVSKRHLVNWRNKLVFQPGLEVSVDKSRRHVQESA